MSPRYLGEDVLRWQSFLFSGIWLLYEPVGLERWYTEMAVFVLLQIIASVGGKIVHNVNVFVAVVADVYY